MRSKNKGEIGLPQVVQGINHDEFWMFPAQYLNALSGIFPDKQREILDSASIGLSGEFIYIYSNRIDPQDDPKLINTEILVYGYDISTGTIDLTGYLLYRGGEWHHSDPKTIFCSDKTFDDIGIAPEVFKEKGEELSPIMKKAINDAYEEINK